MWGLCGISLDVAEVVVLAVDSHPLPRRDARKHPRPEAHEHRQGRMEPDGLVREDAVQVDGGDQGGRLRQHQPHQYGHYVMHKTSLYYAPDLVRRVLL